MNRAWLLAAAVLMVLAPALPGGQEGHPLTGTWRGDWGPTATTRAPLTLVMTWDGHEVSGLLNPGPDALRLGRVAPDWAKWRVVIEAEGKDGSGNPIAIRADGHLEDIGSYNRRITGTWTQNGATGAFTLRRD